MLIFKLTIGASHKTFTVINRTVGKIVWCIVLLGLLLSFIFYPAAQTLTYLNEDLFSDGFLPPE